MAKFMVGKTKKKTGSTTVVCAGLTKKGKTTKNDCVIAICANREQAAVLARRLDDAYSFHARNDIPPAAKP